VSAETEDVPLASFLREVMRRRGRLPSQMAKELHISHATVLRWLKGESIPSTRSCRNLARYSGVPLQKLLSLAGHVPSVSEAIGTEWPEFREYAHQKYPNELDDDLIAMIEALIEKRRQRRYDAGGSQLGK